MGALSPRRSSAAGRDHPPSPTRLKSDKSRGTPAVLGFAQALACWACATCIVPHTSRAEEGSQSASASPSSPPLPFAIADEKRLSDEDLARKKSGTFVTGIPDISFDPLNGFGAGVEGYITFNGPRDDPFFAYTPYRRRIEAEAFVTRRLTRKFRVGFDEPYLFNKKWRLRAEAAYEVNPNQLYFGTTERTLRDLGKQLPAASPYAGSTITSYNTYARRLATVRPGDPGEPLLVADNLYNYYTKDEKILNVSLERAFWDSRMRIVGGFEVAFLRIGHDDGKWVGAFDPQTGRSIAVPNARTRLTEDEAAGRIHGARGGLVTILQTGLVYDTRDLEPNPSRGMFAEITNELSTDVLGSSFTFDKLFVQAKVFYSLMPAHFAKLVLAARIGAGNTFGPAPFFEYADQWSTEGSIEGLGGLRTLRGYKQSRFLGRTMAFGNLEIRYRFAQTKLWGQTLGFMLLPFFDVGGVWDKPSRVNLQNLRYAGGAGARLIWNQSTVVAFDYAFSHEDHQAFLELEHSF